MMTYEELKELAAQSADNPDDTRMALGAVTNFVNDFQFALKEFEPPSMKAQTLYNMLIKEYLKEYVFK